MPGNVAAAAPSGVMPQNLCTAFSESRNYPMLFNGFHDGSNLRFLIQDGVNLPASIRVWKLSQRLTSTLLVALRTFFEAHDGGLIPFYYYNPFEPAGGQPIGSNFDASGISTQGRHTCRFTSQAWSETAGISRTDTALEFIEIA